MRITKQLLLMILNKHKEEYNSKTKVSEVFDYKDVVAIQYGNLTLPFEQEWLGVELIPNTLMPTDKKKIMPFRIKKDLKYLGIKGQLFSTNQGERYISFNEIKQAPKNIDLNELSELEKKYFDAMKKEYKNTIDEFAYKDRIVRADAHQQNQMYINSDDTSDLVYIDVVNNPKDGCDKHQGRIHSKDGKNRNFQTLKSAFKDGLHLPNCRHGIRPYYQGLTKLPKKDNGTYDGSKRQKEVENSAKIRRLQYRNDALDPVKDAEKIKANNQKIKDIKKDGYMPFRTITTFK